MFLTVRPFQVPKAGSQIEECEDALGWDAEKGLFAIADGATDSAFQKLWANLLVHSFIKQPPPDFQPETLNTWFEGWIQAQQRAWHASIDWHNIPWYGLNKARQTGALATFLGIQLAATEAVWRGFAIGDCNLFHFWLTRTGSEPTWQLYEQSPAIHEFDVRPAALSSINPNLALMWKHTHWLTGEYHANDVFLLMTDALAAWLLAELWADRRTGWQRLLTIQDAAEFAQFIEALRGQNQIRNDDTSLLIVEIHEGTGT